jgi:hypothetical protein
MGTRKVFIDEEMVGNIMGMRYAESNNRVL